MTDSVSFWRCLVVDHDELEHEDKYNIGELFIGLTDIGKDLEDISFSEASKLEHFGLLLVIKTEKDIIRRGMPFTDVLKYSVNKEYNTLSFSTCEMYKGTSLVLGGAYDLGVCKDFFDKIANFLKGLGKE